VENSKRLEGLSNNGTYTGDSPKFNPAAGRNVIWQSILSQGPSEREDATLAEKLGSITLLIRVYKTFVGVIEGYIFLFFAFICLGE
jgi:hypothetical protein